jgi:high-affinity K+ transport system ATPase subunit B
MTTPFTPQQAYRRAMRREVYLPLMLAIGVVLAALLVMVLLPTQAQVSVVADWLWTMLVLLPMVICLLPLAIGAVVLALAAARMPGMARKPLQHGQTAVDNASERIAAVLEQIQHVLIEFSARLAGVERMMPLEEQPFAAPETNAPGVKSDEHSAST